jgi:hypothetical protein
MPCLSSNPVQVNGQPTPDLDTFLSVVAMLKDGDFARVKVCHLETTQQKVRHTISSLWNVRQAAKTPGCLRAGVRACLLACVRACLYVCLLALPACLLACLLATTDLLTYAFV